MDIKIFMCCHRQFDIVPPLCIPIQAGAALNPPVAGAISDAEGESISEKNREYCELTAIYSVWRNHTADYYGFCHYRRLFCFDGSVKKPYLAKKSLSEKERQRLLGTPQQISQLLEGCDICIPRAEDMGISARQYYIDSRYHYKEDLELFTQLLCKRHPELASAAEEYLSQSRQYFCNMFIMKQQHFHRYCGILFPLLEEFDSLKSPHHDFQSDRVDGYLAELFTGIFVTQLLSTGANVKFTARIDTSCTLKKRVLYRLCPPESKRRSFLRAIAWRNN